ncbi:hypothetical protein [Acidimangrovimonas sediminis]|uniref:hypothetical protein n=1 Tax=Acidimangrovimonas sediminis TaxID=2056283 RepID=UPI000C8103C5|nr:hypothetical protein [Acidimangrovimonas sediminis]
MPKTICQFNLVPGVDATRFWEETLPVHARAILAQCGELLTGYVISRSLPGEEAPWRFAVELSFVGPQERRAFLDRAARIDDGFDALLTDFHAVAVEERCMITPAG